LEISITSISNLSWRNCFNYQKVEQFKTYQRYQEQKFKEIIHFNQEIIEKDNQRNKQKNQTKYEEKSSGKFYEEKFFAIIEIKKNIYPIQKHTIHKTSKSDINTKKTNFISKQISIQNKLSSFNNSINI
jgi:hypothetical protein